MATRPHIWVGNTVFTSLAILYFCLGPIPALGQPAQLRRDHDVAFREAEAWRNNINRLSCPLTGRPPAPRIIPDLNTARTIASEESKYLVELTGNFDVRRDEMFGAFGGRRGGEATSMWMATQGALIEGSLIRWSLARWSEMALIDPAITGAALSVPPAWQYSRDLDFIDSAILFSQQRGLSVEPLQALRSRYTSCLLDLLRESLVVNEGAIQTAIERSNSRTELARFLGGFRFPELQLSADGSSIANAVAARDAQIAEAERIEQLRLAEERRRQEAERAARAARTESERLLAEQNAQRIAGPRLRLANQFMTYIDQQNVNAAVNMLAEGVYISTPNGGAQGRQNVQAELQRIATEGRATFGEATFRGGRIIIAGTGAQLGPFSAFFEFDAQNKITGLQLVRR